MMQKTIGYLVNQYPKVSHSFIRREILAIESLGGTVVRFAIRACESELVDDRDRSELAKTRLILGVGIVGLLYHLILVALTRPIRFLQAGAIALKFGVVSQAGIAKHLAYLAEACVLLHWASEATITHIHAHFGTNSTTVALLCHLLGGPTYSFTVHGPEEFDRTYEISLREKINQAAFVVAISSFGKSQLYRWCDYSHWSKIHVVRCGVDQNFFNQPPTPIPEEPRLVCVGRLSEQKGHWLLIEAAERLASEDIPFKLVLVGDGPLRKPIEDRIAQSGLSDRIEITGWASNDVVKQEILAARAMVLPSFAEGLPVVIMEALALSRPVLSTYIAGIPELITSECGWLIPAGSVDDLVASLKGVLRSDVETLEHMGKIGAQRVAQHHDVTISAQKLVSLFEQGDSKVSDI